MNGKLFGFVLVLALVLGGVWFLTQKDSGGDRGRVQSSVAPDSAAPSEEALARGASELELDLPSPDTANAAPSEPRAELARSAVEVAASELSEEDSVWLDVTLTLPSGLPLEDEPALLAIARLESPLVEVDPGKWQQQKTNMFWKKLEELLATDNVRWSRKPLNGSTHVRVPFHRDGLFGQLVVESDYLYIDPLQVDIKDPMEPVHLEPKLGGVITGRVLFPPGFEMDEAKADVVEVAFRGRETDKGLNGYRDMDTRDLDVAEDGTFRATRLSAERTYHVKAETDGLATWSSMDVRVQPGEDKALDIPLEVGATISGTVTGDGKPLADVSISTPRMNMFFGDKGSEAKTDENGKYKLTGVSPGKIRVAAKITGWAEAEVQTIEVESDQVFTGIDFALERGLSIAGAALWPDGQPAVGAQVKAIILRNGSWREEKSSTDTLEEGRFVLHGLEEGAYEIRVDAELNEETAQRLNIPWNPSSEPSGMPGNPRTLEAATLLSASDSRDAINTWNAKKQGVEVGTTDVELILKAPLRITGQVLDGQGDPVTEYRVTAKPVGAERWTSLDTSTERVDDESGMFEVFVAFEGSWTLTLESEEYVAEEPETEVETPLASPVTLVMIRAGSLSGTVVDPFGTPVADAQVTATTAEEATDPFQMDWNREPEKTDNEGTFNFKAKGDRLTLTAKHEDWAVSEPLLVELSPSESKGELLLELRVGARITGEVFDAEGKPVASQNVTAGGGTMGPFTGGEATALTDAAGQFAFEHLKPGKITVTAMPSQEEMMKKMAESQDQAALISMFSEIVTETVEVADGEEAHVTLGQKAKNPVRLFGRVTEAGSPVPEAMVIALNDGEGSIMEGMKATRTDDGGHYDFVVDRPGSYVVQLQADNFGGSSIQFFIDVPETDELEHDFTLPAGRIEGRIVDPNGKPVSGVIVDASRDGGSMGMEQFDRTTDMTEEDGSFSFEHRRPDTYTLTVGSGMNFFSTTKGRYAAKVITGIVVREDQVVSGLEIQLELPGTLEGTVVDASGAPVSGAAVHVRNASGQMIARVSDVMTDPGGRFKYEGLPAGDLTVSARTSDDCSTESRSVRIAVGQTTTTEIEVEPGAYLVVQLLDDGEAVRARLRVLDRNGNEVSGLLSMGMMQEMISEGLSSKERRVGPLPPGKYTLEATTPDGKTAKKRVTMKSGDNRRLIKMRLRD